MFHTRMIHMILIFCFVGSFSLLLHTSPVDACKVLVVMSYDEEFWWSQQMQEGIDGVLADTCELNYVYLGTRMVFEQGKEKAKQAYELYEAFQPDGIIACDDNAQSMFVVPYIKDNTDTPVIFCGVNEELETYGYPTSSITGVREVVHFRETLMFLKQLVPSVKTVGYMMRDTSTAQAFMLQAKKEAETYPLESVVHVLPTTFEEAVETAKELASQCDALFIEFLDGLPDKDGNPIPAEESVFAIVETFGKPTVASNDATVKMGAMAGVIKLPGEQGELAAEMVLKAIQGTPISDLPVTKNARGRRILNVDTLKALGIKPKSHVLKGVEIVKTAE